ncbi:hypothetical protein F1652_14510 [Pluralibacter gergoviae]|nr:hypothetical protein [Pluralibacter gergoviae]
MLRYCLFLRSAPHRFKAKKPACTVMVPGLRHAGAGWPRSGKNPQFSDLIKQLMCQKWQKAGGSSGGAAAARGFSDGAGAVSSARR